MLTNEEIITVLNHLITICKNSQNDFQTASKALKETDGELSGLCLQYSEQRAEFASQLQREVRQRAADPQRHGTITGVLHRGWMNAKALVTGGDDDIIIAECEASEDTVKEAYEQALQAYMPAPITELLQKQYAQIKEVHDRFSSLKKAAR